MNYPIIATISIFALALIAIYIYYKSRDKEVYKKYNLREVNANDIDRGTLIKFAQYEKFIYIHGFTRRVLIEYRYKNSILYRAYYYNLLNGVHLYLEANPKKSAESFNFIFATHFNSNQFITYNSSLIDSYDKLADKNSIVEQYKDASIELLYKKHLENRVAIDDEIIYKRLSPKDLLYNRYSQSTKRESSSKELNVFNSKSKKGSYLLLKTILLLSTISVAGYLYYTKIYNTIVKTDISKRENRVKNVVTKKVQPITDINRELNSFKDKVDAYKTLTLTLSYQKSYPTEKSLKLIDNYLKVSRIEREIGKSTLVKIDKNILPCDIPKELEKLYSWHNGVEKLIPARDFYTIEDVVRNYIKHNRDTRENYIILFGKKDGTRGLAYNCKKQGLYEYDAITKEAAKKDFYNIKHFLEIVSNAYKTGAFYDDNGFINIDMKSFLNIYRKHLTKIDKNRYEYLVTYLKQKAIQYKQHGNRKLKLALLNEIESLYDSRLTKSAGLFLNSKDNQIKAKAIEVIGKIGDKNSLQILKPLLKSKNSRVKDFTLLAIANIVDKNNKSILRDIYPLLKDKSTFVRLSAYRVIEKVGNKESLKVLRDNFKKESSSVKIGIIRALAKIGDREDIALLNIYLNKLPDTIDNRDPKEYIRGSKPGNLILTIETQDAINGIESRIRKNFRISSKN